MAAKCSLMNFLLFVTVSMDEWECSGRACVKYTCIRHLISSQPRTPAKYRSNRVES